MLHQDFIEKLPFVIRLLKKHQIKNAYAFGSITTEKFNSKSDIDLLINFDESVKDPLIKGELWWNLHDHLRELFNREIDLLSESSLKNPYFIEELNEKKIKIYG